MIQRSANGAPDIGGAVLVGWVTVCEWLDPDGMRWLSNLDGTNGGEDGLTDWQRQGFLFNALYHDDSFVTHPDDDDEEDEES